MVLEFLHTGSLRSGINEILNCPYPKSECAYFRCAISPVSLCNIIFKIVTNLTTRLKQFLQEVVSPFQSVFVPGWQISDNVIILQEVLHSLRTKRGKDEAMIFKFDLEKAYDRLSWDFIRDTLMEVGLSSNWIRNIMECVQTSRLQILWNGEKLEAFNSSRGLLQGDPMSPYIFVLYMERLSHMITKSVQDGD